MDILDPLSEIFDGKEAVTKYYHKPHPVDENILPKVEKNEELQNNKILFSANHTSDYIKSEQVSVVNEETAWSVMDILVPLSNIFDDRKSVTEDNNKHNSIPWMIQRWKKNLKHRSPEDDEHSVWRLKESDKKTGETWGNMIWLCISKTSASIRHQEREILRNSYNQNMMEFVIYVISVNRKQHKGKA